MANVISHHAGSAPGWETYALKMDGAVAGALNMTPEKLDRLVIAARESIDRTETLVDVA
jgi:hypothetical protein